MFVQTLISVPCISLLHITVIDCTTQFPKQIVNNSGHEINNAFLSVGK